MPALRVLIVEDEALIAMDLEFMVEDMGHTVVGLSASAHDAIEKAAALSPDLVLMDLHLAKRTCGKAAARTIWRETGCRAILVSASLHEVTRDDIEDIKPVAMIPKPISKSQLESEIAKFRLDTAP